ncbi:hypothetical protein [Gordonia humi]|uniref:TY-Chap C-terminal domain-containing protein n=1 Tax=Gordonia humi TaxID=686429 RepID=A0A840EX33_9ACTN|nr:hypothetical protein [Gordonia humi]MBB4134874.1 hypothetical protein [Gordonia humi]
MYRSELERLMTLASDEIEAACRGDRLSSLITRCADENLELSELADDAAAQCDVDRHSFYAQEAAAWRATAQVLRTMTRDRTRAGEQGAA